MNKRKKQLADYLNTLCREANIINDDECCNFFHIQSKWPSIILLNPTLVFLGDTRSYLNDLKDPLAKPDVFIDPNVIELNPQSLQNDSVVSFIEVKEQRGYRNDDVIQFYFAKMECAGQNRQALLKQLEAFYFQVQPKLNMVVLRQLLVGHLDEKIISSNALKYLKKAPVSTGNAPLKYTESVFANQPQGLFILMSDYESSQLTAISAAWMLSKMINYQKNANTE